jgi:molybdate transport system permease protein
LFPHFTVWSQICFGTGADRALASHWIDRLHLRGLEERFPDELSGGQRQRVSLAQALARSPDLLLLDEPFSALDSPVRDELRADLRWLQRESGFSTLLVTHDPEEAAYLADELIVLGDGRVLQAGSREEVFAQPGSPEVARLIGYRNIHRGRMGSNGEVLVGSQTLTVLDERLSPGTEVIWSIRPEAITMGKVGSHEAVILDSADLGAVTSIIIEFGGLRLEARSALQDPYPIGTKCRVELPTDAIRLWQASS